MLFQTLDDKHECFGIYCNGEISYDARPESISKTWNYSSHLSDLNIEYAQLYCAGKTLDEVCPPELEQDWAKVKGKMRAYLTSFAEAQISLNDHCFYSLVPERFLVEMCEVKNKICNFVFENYTKPDNYDFMLKVSAVVGDIANNKIALDKTPLRNHLGSIRGRNLWNNIDTMPRRIRYNPYGTKTGRLSTTKSSFPILTLNKDYRSILVPNNDWFVELDFNAAELRTLLALSGRPQPTEDIHEWNVQNVYGGKVSRDEAKQKIFAWLYNPESKDKLSSSVYRRDEILKEYWDGSNIITPFKRTIGADKKHALNYLIQSTSSDVFMDRVYAIHQHLSERQSHISMLIHDSVVLDVAEADLPSLKEIVNIFSNTCYGEYKVGISVGKTFGDMRSIR